MLSPSSSSSTPSASSSSSSHSPGITRVSSRGRLTKFSLSPPSSSFPLYSPRMAAKRFFRAELAVAALLLLLLLFFWLLVPPYPTAHSSGPVYFLSVADFGTGSKMQKAVAKQMGITALRYRAQFVLSEGDNIYDRGVTGVNDPLFQSYFEDIYTHPSLQCKWYMALGDHDNRGSVAAQVAYSERSARWHLPRPYYSVDIPLGGDHSLLLVVTDSVGLEGAVAKLNDSEDRRFAADYDDKIVGKAAGEQQLQWLEATLAESTADWRVVVGHRPVLTAGVRSRYPAEGRFAEMMKELLEKHRVDAYFFGHDHLGQHLEHRGVHYIGNGVGGYGNHKAAPTNHTIWADDSYGGFLLHKVTPSEMEFTFIAHNGTKMHSLRLWNVHKKAQ